MEIIENIYKILTYLLVGIIFFRDETSPIFYLLLKLILFVL